MILAVAVQASLQLFARGGGGGSSSGGGGGGGGGSILILIGYVPMHLIGAWFRRLKTRHELVFDILQVVGWLIAAVYAVLLVVLFHGYGAVCGFGAIVGMGAGLYSWFGKLKQSKQTKQNLLHAAQLDPAWNEQAILDYVKMVFLRYQYDWSNFDTASMQTYMTPWYHYHASLMMAAVQQAGRRNVVADPAIDQMVIVDVQDAADNSQDTVTVGITARAKDQLIDTRDQTYLFVDSQTFTEFWRFKRNGDGWLLDGIQQATASAWTHQPTLEQFAAQNKFCFSLDWGWLLLPRRGQLFSKGKFGTSDINNHVIGTYNNLLIQLYTYSTAPRNNTNREYLIAQANFPKSYGDIVVRKHGGLFNFGIRGLQKVSTEWPDFNRKYDVYATDPEQATSLELLNPKYMEQLEAVGFEVNIEVVDNVVYLYAPQKAATPRPDRYPVMLQLLYAAFREMRL